MEDGSATSFVSLHPLMLYTARISVGSVIPNKKKILLEY